MPPISSNTKVRIQIRNRSEVQNFPTFFRTPSYNNFLTNIRHIPLHTCYMFRPFLRLSSDMSIQISYKGRYTYNKIKCNVNFIEFYHILPYEHFKVTCLMKPKGKTKRHNFNENKTCVVFYITSL
jgi:hypothetical protein